MHKLLLVGAAVLAVAAAAPQVKAHFAEVDFIENIQLPESRIVSGWRAYPGQLPWQVALRLVAWFGSVSSCGGSVIHTHWAITAAHCTALRKSIIVSAGVTALSSPQQVQETTEWFNYPTYDDSNPGLVQPNDISLLKLNEKLLFTPLLRPIRVQSLYEAFNNYDQEVMIASGFGRTWTDGPLPDHLYWTYLRGVSNPACAALFGSLITDTSICARYYNVTSQSTCQGDSGGPLVHINDEGTPILIGVASFVAGGDFGCHSGLPAGFCRVGPFLSWFKEVTDVDFENWDWEDDDSSTDAPTTTEEPETTQPPTEEPETTQPPTEEPETTQPPTEQPETTEPPTEEPEPTEPPTEEPEDPDSESDEDDSGVSEEDPNCDERCELLKKLDVKVKVHVRMKHRRRRFRSVQQQ